MTTDTSMPAPRPGGSRIGLWVALGALLVGAVVAVLGVRAAVVAYERDRSISDYHDARSVANYYVTSGRTIRSAMGRLQALDDEDVALMNSLRQALEANDVVGFNSLRVSVNSRTGQQQALRTQLRRYQTALARARDR